MHLRAQVMPGQHHSPSTADTRVQSLTLMPLSWLYIPKKHIWQCLQVGSQRGAQVLVAPAAPTGWSGRLHGDGWDLQRQQQWEECSTREVVVPVCRKNGSNKNERRDKNATGCCYLVESCCTVVFFLHNLHMMECMKACSNLDVMTDSLCSKLIAYGLSLSI